MIPRLAAEYARCSEVSSLPHLGTIQGDKKQWGGMGGSGNQLLMKEKNKNIRAILIVGYGIQIGDAFIESSLR